MKYFRTEEAGAHETTTDSMIIKTPKEIIQTPKETGKQLNAGYRRIIISVS